MKSLGLAVFIGLAASSAAATAQTTAKNGSVAAWQKQAEQYVVRHLNASKQQLADALNALSATKMSDRKAVVMVMLDRQGKVLSQRIQKSTGNAAVDRIALNVVAGASPFPALPADIRKETMPLTVPINFASPVGLEAWRMAVVKHLARQIGRAQPYIGADGNMVLQFVLDSNGHVVSRSLKKSSGREALDKYMLQILADADPFPPPRGPLAGTSHIFSASVRFQAGRPVFGF